MTVRVHEIGGDVIHSMKQLNYKDFEAELSPLLDRFI